VEFLGAAEDIRRSSDQSLLAEAVFLQEHINVQTLERLLGTTEYVGQDGVSVA